MKVEFKGRIPFKILRNQRGDMLIPVLLTAAIGATLILGMASAFSNYYRAQKSVSLSDDEKNVIEQIQMTLSDPAACRAAFLNTNLAVALANPSPIIASPTPAPIANLARLDASIMINGISTRVKDPQAPPATPNNYEPLASVPGLGVTMFRFQNSTLPLLNVSIRDPISGALVPRRLLSGALFVQFVKTGTGMAAPMSKPIAIPMTIAVDAAGPQLAHCQASTDEGLTCTAMGNMWLPFGDTGQRCIEMNGCRYGGSFSDGPASEGGFNNPLTGTRSCPSGGYTQRRKGTISYAVSCGKTCMTTNHHNVYECSLCSDGSGAITGNVPGAYTPTSLAMNADADLVDLEQGLTSNYNSINTLYGLVPATSPTPIPTPVPSATPTPAACQPAGTVLQNGSAYAPYEGCWLANNSPDCCSHNEEICYITMNDPMFGSIPVFVNRECKP